MKKFLSFVYEDIRRGENIEIYAAIVLGGLLTILDLFSIINFNILASGILLTLILLVYSTLNSRRGIERLDSSLSAIQQQTSSVLETLSRPLANIQPSQVIKKLDAQGSLDAFLQSSSDVFMSGVNLLTRSNMLKITYRHMLKGGCNFRFIVIDPTSSLLPQLAMGQNISEESLRQEIRAALTIFRDLKDYAEENHTTGKFEYVAFDYLPTLTLMRTTNVVTGGVVIHVEIPGYRRGIWDRPAFRLTHVDGELFTYFERVCSDLWADATSQRRF